MDEEIRKEVGGKSRELVGDREWLIHLQFSLALVQWKALCAGWHVQWGNITEIKESRIFSVGQLGQLQSKLSLKSASIFGNKLVNTISEKSVRNYYHTLRKIPEERRSQASDIDVNRQGMLLILHKTNSCTFFVKYTHIHI